MRACWLALPLVCVPLLIPAPASALSCVPLSEQKPYSSFAGTVVKQRGDAYLFVVREVWSGPDLNTRTWVGFDRLWSDPVPEVGQPWVIYADEGGRANTCTITPDEAGAEGLRPKTVRKPEMANWWSAIRTALLGTSLLVPTQDIGETG